MQCPVCNNLNAATDVRCLQCGTTLIHEALRHTSDYRAATDSMDTRMYGGIGAFFGFCIVGALLKFILTDLWLSAAQICAFAAGGAVAGRLAGQLFLRAKRRGP